MEILQSLKGCNRMDTLSNRQITRDINIFLINGRIEQPKQNWNKIVQIIKGTKITDLKNKLK